MSDVISDAKLVSLNEGRTPRSSVDYDQLLSKAAALLKEKNEREVSVWPGWLFLFLQVTF